MDGTVDTMDTPDSECNNRTHGWIIARCRNTTLAMENSTEV